MNMWRQLYREAPLFDTTNRIGKTTKSECDMLFDCNSQIGGCGSGLELLCLREWHDLSVPVPLLLADMAARRL